MTTVHLQLCVRASFLNVSADSLSMSVKGARFLVMSESMNRSKQTCLPVRNEGK